MLKEFKEFAIKGNVIDMAVGIIIGAGFSTLVKSMVDDLFMPPLGTLMGGLDFTEKYLVLRQGASPAPYTTLAEAKAAGATVMAYGNFVNSVVAFFMVAIILFFVQKHMSINIPIIVLHKI